MAESKAFNLLNKNGNIKLQIGKDVFGLDVNEKKRIHRAFKKALDTTELVPMSTNGTLIMYENGLIAASINVGKMDLAGTKFLLMVYSLTPNSDKYDVNNFLLTREALEKYIDMLK